MMNSNNTSSGFGAVLCVSFAILGSIACSIAHADNAPGAEAFATAMARSQAAELLEGHALRIDGGEMASMVGEIERRYTHPSMREHALRGHMEREAARQVARLRGWPLNVTTPEGADLHLAGYDPATGPRYLNTLTLNAARSTATDLVVGNPVYGSPNGAGLTIGIWDSGYVRPTHSALVGRVTSGDGILSQSAHSTLVAGTAAAAVWGTEAAGMAPAARIRSYDYFNDFTEMTAAARRAPEVTSQLLVSNHSYTHSLFGWARGSIGLPGTRIFWAGTWGEDFDSRFGAYTEWAAAADDLVWNAPYYLPVWAAGNDRSTSTSTNAPPTAGQTFYFYDTLANIYVPMRYDATMHPTADSEYNGGYDTLVASATGKNMLTVGAVNDAVLAGVRFPENGTTASFSSWGPTDDGRIKPDVVGNGVSVRGPVNTSDTAYTAGSGTSYAAPNVAGSALLLQEIYQDHHGQPMRAASLRGLIIHTATDIGTPGPDYIYGYGLMDTEKAAQLLMALNDQGFDSLHLREDEVNNTRPSRQFTVRSDGSQPLRATLAWTDPAGLPSRGANDRTPRLIHDLDLAIIGPGGTYLPFRLDPDNPSAAATTGVNSVDNVEQVLIESPAAGLYTINITSHTPLARQAQPYTLLVSGQTAPTLTASPAGEQAFLLPFGALETTPLVRVVTLSNDGIDPIDFTITSGAAWLEVTPATGTIAPSSTADVSLYVDVAEAATLTPGTVRDVLSIASTPDGDLLQRDVRLCLAGPVPTPFHDGFEGCRLTPFWTTVTTGAGRATITPFESPWSGAYHLILDTDEPGGMEGTSTVEMMVDLTSAARPEMCFTVRRFNFGAYPAPTEPFGLDEPFDGVSISVDGVNYYAVVQFNGPYNQYRSYTIDLKAALDTHGLIPSAQTRLAIHQYGEDPAPMGGYAIDDIRVSNLAPVPSRQAWAWDSTGERLITFQLDDPSSVTPLPASGPYNVVGLAFVGGDSSRIIALEATGELHAVDPVTGEFTYETTLPPMFLQEWKGLTWNWNDGALYAISGNASKTELVRVDMNPWRLKAKGSIAPNMVLEGLASKADSPYLYSLLRSEQLLVRITPDGATATRLGEFNLPMGDAMALCFDPASAALFALRTTASLADLMIANTWTGGLRFEGSLAGASTISAMALMPTLPAGRSAVHVYDATIPEGDAGPTLVNLTLELHNPQAQAVALNYTFTPETASAGRDYSAQSGVVVVPAGATQTTFPVRVFGDSHIEGNEVFVVEFYASQVPMLYCRRRAIITIADDDTVPKLAYFQMRNEQFERVELHKPQSTVQAWGSGGFNAGGADTEANGIHMLAWNADTNELTRLSIDTGEVVGILGTLAPPAPAGARWTGLARHRGNGNWYATASNGMESAFFVIGLSPVSASSLGTWTSLAAMSSLAAHPTTNWLYAVNHADGRFIQIDPGNGEFFRLGYLSFDIGALGTSDGSFAESTDGYYLAAWNSTEDRAEIHSVDLQTGRSAYVETIGDGSTAPGAFAITPISVPVTLSLWTLD